MFSHDPIEWPDEVEVLVDRLESESAGRKLTREERALIADLGDTYRVFAKHRARLVPFIW